MAIRTALTHEAALQCREEPIERLRLVRPGLTALRGLASSHGESQVRDRVTKVSSCGCSAAKVDRTCLMSSRPNGTPLKPTNGGEIE